ncbi:sensor histidine kinase [Sphaerisporangium dianthi]|uniref:histidine kinase n=1 Tax=Sphaerisporangium dianthi TaxID=1436120 RepID=A0ABV9CMR1_9ACTN
MGTGRSSNPVAWAKTHPLAADASLGGVLAAVSLLALAFQTRAEHLPPPGTAAVVLILLINVPLVWRRRHPFWANLAAGVASGVYGATPLPDLVTSVPLGGLVAMYSMAAWCDDRRRSVVVGLISGAAVVAVAVYPATDSDLLDFAFGALALGSAWVLGDSARIRRAYTAELEARTAWLAREQDLEARRAVTAERARIARELHDVIAHHVSMMVVQAEAGPVAAERDELAAARAFDTISGIGRQALVEMRRLLGVLREETGDKDAGLAPQPGVAQLPGLVEQVRLAGLEAVLEIEGDPVPLPAGVDLSAYRIVQEALTNVRKHVGPARARVRLCYGDREVRVEIHDAGPRDQNRNGPALAPAPDAREVTAGMAVPDGRGVAAVMAVPDGWGVAMGKAATGRRDAPVGEAVPGPEVAHHAANGTRGHGLVGMRERAQLFGGELTAGPAPGGGFTVVARLPIGGTR